MWSDKNREGQEMREREGGKERCKMKEVKFFFFLDVKGRFIKRLMREERSRGQENEKTRIERGRWGALWLLLCRNVNTLQRSQKTMTPRGEEGASVSDPLRVCVCVRGRARQRHRGERKENDGGEMRRREC